MAARVRCMVTLPRPIGWAAARVRRGARGQATLEFALFLPILLLIALIAVDVGRMSFDYIGLRSAAMEGAIYGSHNPTDASEATDRVREHFLPNPPPAGLAVAASADAACSGPGSIGQNGFFTVTASREFRPFSLAALQTLAPGTNWIFQVESTARARCMT